MTTRRSLAAITCAALVLALPLILFGYPREVHDSLEHVPWATNFARVFWSGTIYPRWMPDMNEGVGSPIFFYYPPGAYWLSALFDFGPDRVLSGGFQLRIAMPVALILSGLACFVFLRGLVDRSTATLGAIIYTANPYHLIEIYMRGDIPEFVAFIFVPLVLTGLNDAVHRPLRGMAVTAVSFAALVFSHPLAAVVSSPVFAAYALFKFGQHRSWAGLGASAGGAVLGLALTAVYLVPALAMQDFVYNQPTFITPGFLFGSTNRLETFVYAIWAVFLFSAVALGIAYASRKKIVQRPELMFWLLAGAVYCLFLTRLAAPFWLYVKSMHFLQYPFRINVALVMAVTVSLTLWVSQLTRPRKKAVVGVCMLVGLVVAAEPVVGNNFKGNPVKWEEAARCAALKLYRPVTAPHWVCGTRLSPLARTPSERAWLADGRVEIVRWASRDIQLKVQSSKQQTLYVSQFVFPGWKAVLDDGRVLPLVHNADQIVAVTVPKGTQRVSFTLDPLPPERWSWRISWIGLVMVLLLAAMDVALRRNLPVVIGRKLQWRPDAQPS